MLIVPSTTVIPPSSDGSSVICSSVIVIQLPLHAESVKSKMIFHKYLIANALMFLKLLCPAVFPIRVPTCANSCALNYGIDNSAH